MNKKSTFRSVANNYLTHPEKTNGITLIALIITVIVLLILAGTAISIAINGGDIFGKAATARESWNSAVAAEEQKVNEVWQILNTMTSGNNGGGGGTNPTATPTPTPAEALISKETTANSGNGYVGYYADMDNDGTVDGIIYADMLVGNTKNKESHMWNNDDWSVYNVTQISDATTVKDYCISTKTYAGQTEAGKYQANAGFGLKDVIVPATNSTGTIDRFYIMQLSDFTNNSKNTFYWYKEAIGKLGRAVSTSTDDFGSGKQNTINMLNDWNNNTATYGAQTTSGDYIDLWGAIQDGQYNLVTTTSDSRKWFVPSKGEWSAFGGELNISKTSTDATYYGNCGLSSNYWASSQNTTNFAYSAVFYDGYMNGLIVNNGSYVRLSATF